MTPTPAARNLTRAARWAGRPDPRLPQWWRTTRWMLAMQLYLALWFWAIVLLVEVAAMLVVAQLGEASFSFFQFATHGALWFPFAIMIITSGAMLTPHVVQGCTRRSFIIGALLVALVLAVLYGAIMTAGLALEGAVYDALGWTHSHIAQAASDADVLVPWQEPAPLTWLTYATRTGGGAVGGLLVGAGYYRFGPWRGTALLLVVALPAVAAQDSISGFLHRLTGSGLNLNAVLILILMGLGALAYTLLVRRIPLISPRS